MFWVRTGLKAQAQAQLLVCYKTLAKFALAAAVDPAARSRALTRFKSNGGLGLR